MDIQSLIEQIQMTEDRFSKRRQTRESSLTRLEAMATEEDYLNAYTEVEGRKRIAARLSYVNINDGLGRERIIGRSDLLEVNYLELGLKASMPVCRIELRSITGMFLGHGTGFLVSPLLLMTNNHVLRNADDCRRSIAQFNYESDVYFIPKETKSFLLDPDRFFYTDKKLDFSLVAVKSIAMDGTPLSNFGFLKLFDQPGKALLGEFVTLLQHPKGGAKCVVLRENQVIDILDDFIHYVADTEPGSSGSPAFNDQWQLVALHHSGVPKRDDTGRILSRSGSPWEPSMGENQVDWIANEGIRISQIVAHLRSINQASVQKLRELLFEFPPTDETGVSTQEQMETEILPVQQYSDREGYDSHFLGKLVPLPTINGALLNDCLPLNDGSGVELKYTHFSIVIRKSRRLAFYTAVNIDGAKLKNIERTRDKWYFDPRISQEYQAGPRLYSDNKLDRGHLVRRLDPVWGELAENGNLDTFHFTNCAPQHKLLNQKTWLELEVYLLKNAENHRLKLNVFTGPIFRDDDMNYRGEFRIPAEYWKVAVIVKDDGNLSATAYLQTQKNLLEDLEFSYGAYRTYQVPIITIEALTGLDFGKLREYDPIGRIEGAIVRVLQTFEDIVV
jgi:endonuclease G